MKLSVIIPVYNDWHRLLQCMVALENQSIGSDLFEIIVVDNSEKGEIPDGAAISDRVQFIHEPKPGSYAARNRGAEKAKGEILAFTDSDCIPDRNWLLNGYNLFLNSDCDLIGGEVDIFRPDNGREYAYVYDKLTAFNQKWNISNGHSVTANLFVKKKVFEDMERFNSDLKSGGDWDFTRRSVEKGYKMVYSKDVWVQHPSSRDLRKILKKQYRLACWGGVIAKKRYGHSQFRIMISEIYQSAKLFFQRDKSKFTFRERWILFYVDSLRFMVRSFVQFGILIRVIRPTNVRE